DVQDRALRRDRLGHACASPQAAPGTTGQPRAIARNASRADGDAAPPRRVGRKALMLVVVGGHSRNLGKTSVTAGLIRKLRDRQWTAVKITQYGHGVCAQDGNACGCEAETGEEFAVSEEYEPNGMDTGRYLAAGAE